MKINIIDIRVEQSNDLTKRVRKDFSGVPKLAKNIGALGLLHPIVVNHDQTGEKKYILIAGERRLRACIFLGWTKIPATVLDDMNEFDRKVCELAENVVRQDLTWEEQIEAMSQLHDLQQAQHGKATTSKNNKGWTIEDTAEMIGLSKGGVSQDIKLALDLKNQPELREKVSKLPKHAARKIVNQTMEENILKRQISMNEMTISSDLRLGDCVELIQDLRDESVDLWLTDPPFASKMVADLSKASSSASPTYNLTQSNVSTEGYMQGVYEELIPAVYKKLKPGAHIYVFFGHDWYCRLYQMLTDGGFVVDSQPLIWAKQGVTGMSKDMHYMSSYEAIFFGHKPPVGRILTKPVPNVLSVPVIHPSKRVHPLQRPFELLKILIENSTGVGQTILDTFAGSASTIHAAKRLQRSGIGFELDSGNYLRAQKWLGE